MTAFNVIYSADDRTLEMMDSSGAYYFLRIPYYILDPKDERKIPKDKIKKPSNKFIVYLLSGKDKLGQDCLYVGTSKKNIDNRPVEHEDKDVDWKECYVITSVSDKVMSLGRILCLEDMLKHRIQDSGKYICKTFRTEKETTDDEDSYCEEALPKIIMALDIMGVNITRDTNNILNDYSFEPSTIKPVVEKHTDISSLKLPMDMEEWLITAEKIVASVDPELKPNLAGNYVSFKYDGVSSTLAYFIPLRNEKQYRVILYGYPEDFADKKVTLWEGSTNYGKYNKSVFLIKNADDLGYFRIFIQKAIINKAKYRQKNKL